MAAGSVEVARSLSSEGLRVASRDLDETLSHLVCQAQQVLGSDAVSLYLRDRDDPRLLRVKAASGLASDLQSPYAVVGSSIAGLPVTTLRCVVLADHLAADAQPFAERVEDQVEDRGTFLELVRAGPVSATDPVQPELDWRIAGTFRTMAAIPLVAGDEAYGSLLLYYHAPRAYGADNVGLSLAFAQQAALAIENAHLRAEADQRLAEIERRRRVADGLRDLRTLVNSTRDLDEILAEVLAQSRRLLGSDASVVYLRDTDESDILRARAWRGVAPKGLAREIRVGSPTSGLAVQQARTLICEDLAVAVADEITRAADTRLEEEDGFARVVRFGAQTDPDLEPGHTQPRVRRPVDRIRAVASTPLIARGRVFGAVAQYFAEPRTFSAEDLDLARALAEQATQAVYDARLQAEVERRMHESERRRRVAEGIRDLLAGINSTRSLDEVLDLVLGQAAGVLGCDAGSVLLLDDRQDKQAILTMRATRALVAELIPSRLPVGTAITGVAVERRRPVVVTDLQEAAPLPGEPEPVIQPGPGYLKLLRIGSLPEGSRIREVARYYRSILAVPLAVHGRVMGAITLYYPRPREFSREELGLAQAFADQTALAVENARLHAQTVRRSRDLEALYRADEVLYRSLHVQQVLRALVDVASDVLEADMCSVLVWDERHERLVPGATRGFWSEDASHLSYVPGEGITTQVALTGQPIAVEDAMNDPRVAHRESAAEGIRSLLHVPIKVNGAVFGVFGVNYREPRELSGDEERVLLALAHRAALAIENAQLYTESEQRRQELEALYRADHTLHSSLRLDDVLRALLDVATDVMHADKIAVTIWDPLHQQLVSAAARGYRPESLSVPLIAGQDVAVDDLMGVDLIVVTDAANDPRLATPRLRDLVRREGIRTALAAPIMVSGQPFGLFSVAFCTEHVPSSGEQRLAQALAQRAGLAVQNARLYEQAQQAATLEERQRLARELHDAVTQTLFSASLIAEVLPQFWRHKPDEVLPRLEQLRQLSRGALAEMRTLLLELRPAALSEMSLTELLRQLVEASLARVPAHLELRIEGSPRRLPADVQVGLYRLAQEALNNLAKHAQASQAEVHLRWTHRAVILRIRDDGRGFEPALIPAGHLGIGFMRERAAAIAATLDISSRPSAGTTVTIHWPTRRARAGTAS